MKEQIFKVGDIVMFNDIAYSYMLRLHNTDSLKHIIKNLLGKMLTIKSDYNSYYSVYEDINRCVYPAFFLINMIELNILLI